MYKKAKECREHTSGGLTEVKVKAGTSIEEKLNKMCPHFKKMDVVFGERANINPPALGNLGLEVEESCSLDSQIPNSQIPDVCTKEGEVRRRVDNPPEPVDDFHLFEEEMYKREQEEEIANEEVRRTQIPTATTTPTIVQSEVPTPTTPLTATSPQTPTVIQSEAPTTRTEAEAPIVSSPLEDETSHKEKERGEDARPKNTKQGKSSRGNVSTVIKESVHERIEYKKSLLEFRKASLEEKKKKGRM